MWKLLLRVVFSRWYFAVMLVALMLFVMPANSPLGIPRDYKVIPALLFVVALFELIAVKWGK